MPAAFSKMTTSDEQSTDGDHRDPKSNRSESWDDLKVGSGRLRRFGNDRAPTAWLADNADLPPPPLLAGGRCDE